jgi:hypothetical protein
MSSKENRAMQDRMNADISHRLRDANTRARVVAIAGSNQGSLLEQANNQITGAGTGGAGTVISANNNSTNTNISNPQAIVTSTNTASADRDDMSYARVQYGM